MDMHAHMYYIIADINYIIWVGIYYLILKRENCERVKISSDDHNLSCRPRPNNRIEFHIFTGNYYLHYNHPTF